MKKGSIHTTNSRSQINDLDNLPITDRSLIDYEKYHQFISNSGVKYSMAIQATRGCLYKCFYCDIHKISPGHYRRSVKHLFNEVRLLADIGVKRIEFIDDIFNANREHCISFFELVLKHQLDLNFYFINGLRGDILSKDMIDLMVEAGAASINLSLEHPSPRLQKIMRKNLNIDKLRENLQYIAGKYPYVVLGLNAMHGFPTETEEEALETLEFIKSIKWIHFPYLVNVRVFPGTDIEKLALKQGISKEAIEHSQNLAFEEAAPTLSFSKNFTKGVKTMFLKDYVLNKERLRHVLPYQMEQFSEDELNQKYNSYFPTRIKTLDDLLGVVKINRSDLSVSTCLDESQIRIPDLNTRIREKFPSVKKRKDALKLLLFDLSLFFSQETDTHERVLCEPPLGLLALLSYINQEFGDRVEGEIYKARIDFDSYEELYNIIIGFGTDIIGIRTLTFYKGFLHKAVAYIRERGITVPIIVGGPYASGSFAELLQDKNIDLAVISEGEKTLAEILEQTLANNKHLPDVEVLKKISGIAFLEEDEIWKREHEESYISFN